MSDSAPAPGWYPDPAGGGSRWWDGRSWTEFRHAPAAAGVQQPPLPEGTSTGTPWIYLQALVPIAQLAVQVPYTLSLRSLFAAQFALMERSADSGSTAGAVQAMQAQLTGSFGGVAITGLLSFGFAAGWVLLAAVDARRLERVGIVRPFHWGWSFLGIVYPIGRAVVLQRRVKQGFAPLGFAIGAYVVNLVAVVVLETVIFAPLITQLGSIGTRSVAP